ncbi:MAG: arsenic efflux protein [Clostridia bacterium]|nr:arsenic efflux protein [Clostridia bacterium]
MTDFFNELVHELIHILEHTVIDSLNLLPFLFLAYFIVEFVEHKSSEKSLNVLKKVGRFGAVPGALLGIIPQCGFSVAAVNLFNGGIITLGTLIAVFLSTSDEAVILLFANGNFSKYAFYLIGFKIVTGILFGLLFDLINKNETNHCDDDFCKNCNCENGIIRAAFTHTVSIFIYIVAASFVINILTEFCGDMISNILLKGSWLQPFFTALVGFIPGCAVSITFSELFMAEELSFGSLLAGLLTNAGMGLLVLVKTYPHKKTIAYIMFYMYVISVVCGVLTNLLFL